MSLYCQRQKESNPQVRPPLPTLSVVASGLFPINGARGKQDLGDNEERKRIAQDSHGTGAIQSESVVPSGSPFEHAGRAVSEQE